MTDLFLLKLIAELLSSDKPTADEIGVVKKVVKEMIDEYEPKKQLANQYIPPSWKIANPNPLDNALDDEASQAKQELTQ